MPSNSIAGSRALKGAIGFDTSNTQQTIGDNTMFDAILSNIDKMQAIV